MADPDLGSIAKRLERIEHALDLINHGDPPPDDFVRFRPALLQLRLIDLLRGIMPKGDPPAPDLVRQSAVQARLGEILQRHPGWFTDPPPDDFLNVRLLDLVRRWRGGFTDPAPDDLANVRLRDLLQRIPGGGIVDPGPEDIARLTKSEAEAQIHKINAEVVRLKSIERLLNERLASMKA